MFPRPLLCALLLVTTLMPAAVPAQVPAASTTEPARPSDLDALMARVLANRDQSWRRLQEYLLAEREVFRLVGPDGAPMFGVQNDYLWVAREGRAVRSPVRINGVSIGDETRRKAEAEWQAEEDRRARKAREAGPAGAGDAEDVAGPAPASEADLRESMRSGEPRFISEMQLLRFRFEPGNYYLAGKDTLAGREVLRIEYYPRRLFTDEAKRARDGAPQEPKVDEDAVRIERAMNKVSLVTLWVDPLVDQVVRYTFDNVDFNFLPGRSVVRVDTATVTMTMGQPFEGVWLPASLAVEGALTLATGTYRAEYTRRFSDYRQTDVQMRFRVKDDE